LSFPGQQRLTTIFGFININSINKKNRSRVTQSVKVIDAGKEISKNKLIQKINTSSINCVEVNSKNENAKYELFRILNQGSVSLNKQELRNNFFTMSFPLLNDKLKFFGDKLIKFKFNFKRMLEQEFALRFYIVNSIGYDSDVSKQMNDLNIIKKLDDDLIEKISTKFNKFIKVLERLFGNDINGVFKTLSTTSKHPSNNSFASFVFSDRINQGLFHLFSYYIPKFSSNKINRVKPQKFKEQLLILLKNKSFLKVITGSGTNNARKIKESKKIFEEVFLENTFGDWTKKEARNISRQEIENLKKNVPFCYLSYSPLNNKKLSEIDHIKPFKYGFKSSLKNLLPALKKYNRQKSSSSLENFRQRQDNINIRTKNKIYIRKYISALKNWHTSYKIDQFNTLIQFAEKDLREL
jgi:hypothetical protein